MADRPGALFCGSCGHELGERPAGDRTHVRRAMGAVAILFLGVLGVLLLLSALGDSADWWVHESLGDGAFVALVLLAGWTLGGDALRSSIARGATVRDVSLGGLLGLGVLLFNLAWIKGLDQLVGGDDPGEEHAPLISVPLLLLSIAVLPALIEEWMCRGMLWVALRRFTDGRTAIFTTATLFALLHGLGGAQLLELPGRFILGLVLGWLRHRTGSLLPCVAAHFVNNALVVVFLIA